jgi:hypothetical protein
VSRSARRERGTDGGRERQRDRDREGEGGRERERGGGTIRLASWCLGKGAVCALMLALISVRVRACVRRGANESCVSVLTVLLGRKLKLQLYKYRKFWFWEKVPGKDTSECQARLSAVCPLCTLVLAVCYPSRMEP